MTSLYENLFLPETDFKQTFTKQVDELIIQELSNEFKIKFVNALVEAYYEQTGRVPDPYELSRLATWLVVDTTNNPHKISNTEYPILSHDQLKLRQRRELVHGSICSLSDSGKHRMNGRRSPKNFKVFGEYEGGY